MHFTVATTPTADQNLKDHYCWLQGLESKGEIPRDYPGEWYDEVEDALYSLEEMPERCPLAPEGQRFGVPLRHLVLRNGYRIIFEVQAPLVRVLYIRHPRQSWVAVHD